MNLADALPIVINLAKAAVAYDSSDESEPAEQMEAIKIINDFVAKALYEESLNVPDENTVTPSCGCVFCDMGLRPVAGWHKTVTENIKCPLVPEDVNDGHA